MNNIVCLIEKVVSQLQEKIKAEANAEKLEILLTKYQATHKEIVEKGCIETQLIGGVRAYLDSYSDYMDNPLLDDMYAVEKAFDEKRKASGKKYVNILSEK